MVCLQADGLICHKEKIPYNISPSVLYSIGFGVNIILFQNPDSAGFFCAIFGKGNDSSSCTSGSKIAKLIYLDDIWLVWFDQWCIATGDHIIECTCFSGFHGQRSRRYTNGWRFYLNLAGFGYAIRFGGNDCSAVFLGAHKSVVVDSCDAGTAGFPWWLDPGRYLGGQLDLLASKSFVLGYLKNRYVELKNKREKNK